MRICGCRLWRGEWSGVEWSAWQLERRTHSNSNSNSNSTNARTYARYFPFLRTRLIEQNEWVKRTADAKIAENQAQVLNSQLVASSLRGAIEVLESKIDTSEKTRLRDVKAIRNQAEDAFLLLQRTLKEQAEASDGKEKRYEEAISVLSTEFNAMKFSFEEQVAKLGKEIETQTSMSVALRYDLGAYHVREEVSRKEIIHIKDIWRKEVDSLKVQLRSERNHTARLELWIAAMHDDVKFYLKEIKLREQWLLAKQQER